MDESLSPSPFASPESAAVWAIEINRRISAYERGEGQASDAELSLERMREFLSAHRAH
jgi:hypothetical protein